jgi:hypothetical protein
VVPHAAVRVDDDLAAGQPGVALRPSHHEATRRVHPDLRILVEQVRRDRRLDDGLAHGALELGVRNFGRMLGRYDDRLHAGRSSVAVLDGDLRFPVGAEEAHGAVLAAGGQTSCQRVREHDRHGHQRVGLPAGVSEHHALITRSPRVDAHGDVAGLLVDRRQDGAAGGIEPKAEFVYPIDSIVLRAIF